MKKRLLFLAAAMMCASFSFAANTTKKKKSSIKKGNSTPLTLTRSDNASLTSLSSAPTDTTSEMRNLSLSDMIYVNLEEADKASFPGGAASLKAYLDKNIYYPREAAENGSMGSIKVVFVVEKDGTLTDIKVASPVDASLDAEALRVVKGMPKWKPGMKDGQPVRSMSEVVVDFILK